jgi:hypothetical protein
MAEDVPMHSERGVGVLEGYKWRLIEARRLICRTNHGPASRVEETGLRDRMRMTNLVGKDLGLYYIFREKGCQNQQTIGIERCLSPVSCYRRALDTDESGLWEMRGTNRHRNDGEMNPRPPCEHLAKARRKFYPKP